jgi:hypothetical protein
MENKVRSLNQTTKNNRVSTARPAAGKTEVFSGKLKKRRKTDYMTQGIIKISRRASAYLFNLPNWREKNIGKHGPYLYCF